MSDNGQEVDSLHIIERIERLPMTRVFYIIGIAAAVGYFFDIFDINTISAVAPALEKIFSMNSTYITITLSMGFIGMAIGSILSGRWSDIFGRKRLFTITLVIAAIGSLLTAIATNVYELWIFRLITGFGIGGDLPVIWAYMSEMIPSRLRGRFFGFAMVIGVLSVPATTYAAAYFLSLSLFDWRYVFVLGAVIALAIYPIRLIAPESPRWYLSKGNLSAAEESIDSLEKKVKVEYGKELPAYDSATSYLINEVKFPVKELFNKKYRKSTTVASLAWIFQTWAFYGYGAFLPLILVAKGFSIVTSVEYAAIGFTGGFLGPLLVSFIGDRWQRKYQLILYGAVAGIGALALGLSTLASEVIISAFIVALAEQAWATMLYAYVPEIFPTDARSSGGGFANALGRGFNVIGLFVIGVALAGSSLAQLSFVAVSWFASAIVILVAGVLTTNMVLEDIDKDEKFHSETSKSTEAPVKKS